MKLWTRSGSVQTRMPTTWTETDLWPRIHQAVQDELGRHRYKVGRSITWLGSYRRLNVSWERRAPTFPAMLGIACVLICYKHLAKHADGF